MSCSGVAPQILLFFSHSVSIYCFQNSDAYQISSYLFGSINFWIDHSVLDRFVLTTKSFDAFCCQELLTKSLAYCWMLKVLNQKKRMLFSKQNLVWSRVGTVDFMRNMLYQKRRKLKIRWQLLWWKAMRQIKISYTLRLIYREMSLSIGVSAGITVRNGRSLPPHILQQQKFLDVMPYRLHYRYVWLQTFISS